MAHATRTPGFVFGDCKSRFEHFASRLVSRPPNVKNNGRIGPDPLQRRYLLCETHMRFCRGSGRPETAPGRLWSALGVSWASRWGFLGAPGCLLGSLGATWERSWGLLDVSWGFLGRSGTFYGGLLTNPRSYESTLVRLFFFITF